MYKRQALDRAPRPHIEGRPAGLGAGAGAKQKCRPGCCEHPKRRAEKRERKAPFFCLRLYQNGGLNANEYIPCNVGTGLRPGRDLHGSGNAGRRKGGAAWMNKSLAKDLRAEFHSLTPEQRKYLAMFHGFTPVSYTHLPLRN